MNGSKIRVLALDLGLSVLKTFRSDAPTPAHTLREE